MHKYWAWLGLNLGKHAGRGLVPHATLDATRARQLAGHPSARA